MWVALTAAVLVACWLLGASPTATVVAAVLVALVAVPLLVPAIRLPFVTAPLLGFLRKACRRCRRPRRVALEAGTSASKASCSPASRTGTSCSAARSPS